MIIKVCGMREADNIRSIEALRPDWLGFIFWPQSSRYVSSAPPYLPIDAKRVGVFVDQAIDEVSCTAHDYALDLIQLHGHESPDYLRRLRAVVGDAIAIVKAFSIATAGDLQQTARYEGLADYFLFDNKGPSVGGNGQQFDWTVLESYTGCTPFLLSGGIGPSDAEHIRAFHHPQCAGIDLNSRFEIAPGLKDADKLESFIKQIRNEQDQ